MDHAVGADPGVIRHLSALVAGKADAAIAALEGTGSIRVLKRFDLAEGATGVGNDVEARVGIAVDVETTGLDPKRDQIIELAMRRFMFDADGRITRLGRGYGWLEDPGFPLPAEIVRITGIHDAELAGRRIDEAMAEALLSSAPWSWPTTRGSTGGSSKGAFPGQQADLGPAVAMRSTGPSAASTGGSSVGSSLNAASFTTLTGRSEMSTPCWRSSVIARTPP